MKPGISIRLLEDIPDPKHPKEILLQEYDIVFVKKVKQDSLQVRDILDNLYWIPDTVKYKVIPTKKLKSILKSSATELQAVTPDVDQAVRAAAVRAVQQAQVIAANALSTDDPLVAARYSIAASFLAMSVSDLLTSNSINKLFMLAKKMVVNS
jgi:hypothetical protein